MISTSSYISKRLCTCWLYDFITKACKQGKFIYSTILNASTIWLFRVFVFIVYSIQIKGGPGNMPPQVFRPYGVSAITKIKKSIFPLGTTFGKSRYLPEGLNYWKPKRLNFVVTLDSCPPNKALKKRGFNNFDDNIQQLSGPNFTNTFQRTFDLL